MFLCVCGRFGVIVCFSFFSVKNTGVMIAIGFGVMIGCGKCGIQLKIENI